MRCIILLILALLISCDEESSPSLPNITTNGNNTIGFMTGDKVWLPDCNDSTCILGGIVKDRKMVSLATINYDIFDERLISDGLDFNNSSRIYIQLLYNNDLTIQEVKITYRSFHNYTKILTSEELGHEFELLKLDTINGIFSGKFDIELSYIDSLKGINEKVYLSDGRFDVKLRVGNVE